MKQDTSIEAYYGLENLGDRQIQVFTIIDEFGGASNTMVAKKLNLPISSITPRTRELVRKGLVVESHKSKCPHTHKNVIFWRVK